VQGSLLSHEPVLGCRPSRTSLYQGRKSQGKLDGTEGLKAGPQTPHSVPGLSSYPRRRGDWAPLCGVYNVSSFLESDREKEREVPTRGSSKGSTNWNSTNISTRGSRAIPCAPLQSATARAASDQAAGWAAAETTAEAGT